MNRPRVTGHHPDTGPNMVPILALAMFLGATVHVFLGDRLLLALVVTVALLVLLDVLCAWRISRWWWGR